VADIFREVDEEVRKDELTRLWQRWGKLIIAGAIAVILAAAGFSGWREWQASRRAAAGDAFLAAIDLAAQGRHADAAQALVALAEDAPGGYADLARLRAGHAYAAAEQPDAALATFDALTRDDGAEPTLRDLARLAGAMLLTDGGDPAEVATRLGPLLQDTNGPLYGLARELEGLQALKAGDTAGALAIFKALADDAATSSGLRARAAEIADILE
jgi:hypothetical protein